MARMRKRARTARLGDMTLLSPASEAGGGRLAAAARSRLVEQNDLAARRLSVLHLKSERLQGGLVGHHHHEGILGIAGIPVLAPLLPRDAEGVELIPIEA